MRTYPLLILIVLFVGLGCAPKKVKPITPASYPAFPKIISLSGLAEVDLMAKGKQRSFQAALLIEKPNRLRISLLDEMGQEHAGLIANGQKVFYWNDHTGKEKLLPQDGEALKKTLKLPLGVNEFIDLLLRGPASDLPPANYTVRLQDYQETTQGSYPFHWTWQFLRPKAQMDFQFVSLNLNPRLSSEKFQLGAR